MIAADGFEPLQNVP